jgi:hypothetical protein
VVYGGGAADISSSIAVAKAADEVRWNPHAFDSTLTQGSNVDTFNRTVRYARVCVGSGLDPSGSGREQRIVADRDLDLGQESTGKRRAVDIGHRLSWEG